MKVLGRGLLSGAVAGSPRAMLTFPTAIALASGGLIGTLRAGSTKDSDDEVIEIHRADATGTIWSGPVATLQSPEIGGHAGTLKLCYLTETAPGHLIAAAMWVDRAAHPGKPLFNAATDGCLPMAIVLCDSADDGQTWGDWRHVPLPATLGPPSLTAPLLMLADGSLAMSIETNKTYEDAGPWPQHAVFLWSQDGGWGWSDPQPVAQDATGRIYNWDLRCGVAPDGRIASFAWTYDTAARAYQQVHRRLSGDNGRTWTAPEPLGFSDQAGRPAMLPDGRVVLPYVDRFGSQTIRARIAATVDAPFDAATEIVLHRHAVAAPDRQGQTGELLADMASWTYGLPFAEPLSDGSVLIVHYAGDDAVLHAHWTRISP